MRLQKSRLCVLHCRPKAVRACADLACLSWCSGNIQLKGAAPDLSAATYQIHDESHTIGNALRWMLMKKYVPYATLQCAAIIDMAGSIVCEARRWNSADTGTYSLLPSVYLPSTSTPSKSLLRIPSASPFLFDSLLPCVFFMVQSNRGDFHLGFLCVHAGVLHARPTIVPFWRRRSIIPL